MNNWRKTSTSFKAMMVGKLLGDGSITIQQGRKPRFQFTHTNVDFKWSEYCYNQLCAFIPLNPPKFKHNIDPHDYLMDLASLIMFNQEPQILLRI